jgi:ubiquinol-cytochrome c reductase cytochrome c1 subunit
MRRAEAKQWFGAAPPDLTVIARARSSEFGSGADWLYTYLRGFYRDDTRPTGWNNTVFANVGMPHVLWELQGEQVMDADHKLTLAKPGLLKPADYDALVGDLVAFLNYMGEPVQNFRKELGVIVLIALAVLFVFAYALKREYWRDIH